jgi:drug/metabolite transporter (DMT)-like permease
LRDHPLFTAYLALISVCFFWGTTYLGIRIALESFSPELLVCLRNIIAGGITLSVARLRGAHLPRGRELWITALNGLLIIGVGNGCLAFAELWIPTGLASIFITTSPFWMVGVDALLPGGQPLHAPTVRGMLIGFAGVLFLLAPSAGGAASAGTGTGGTVAAFLLLQFGSMCWALGSIRQRNRKNLAHPFVSGAIQQLASAVVWAVPALLRPQEVHWSTRGVSAIVYLALFGGIIGFSSFALAIDRLPVALVSIYTYVNPVVAVFLGWLFFREPFGFREATAMAIIFLGVALVRRASMIGGHR